MVARNTEGGVGHFPGYLGVKDALWGSFNPEYKPLQLTGKLAILGDQIFIILLNDRRVKFVRVP